MLKRAILSGLLACSACGGIGGKYGGIVALTISCNTMPAVTHANMPEIVTIMGNMASEATAGDTVCAGVPLTMSTDGALELQSGYGCSCPTCPNSTPALIMVSFGSITPMKGASYFRLMNHGPTEVQLHRLAST